MALKAFRNASYPILSTVLYLLLGWVGVIALDPSFARVPTAGLLWLFSGGLSYTTGVAFFATDSRLPYGHLVWHLFVMAGSACHYFAVLWYAGWRDEAGPSPPPARTADLTASGHGRM